MVILMEEIELDLKAVDVQVLNTDLELGEKTEQEEHHS
jgi:hypothetical protein